MHSVVGHSRLILSLLVSAGFCIWAACPCLGSSHSAAVLVAQDPYVFPWYTGISTPSGPFQINITPGTPGYLNGISGGQDGGSDGMALITATGAGSVYLVGLAIDVSDTAGPSHSLSSLGDPALGDIVNDLRNQSIFGEIVPYAYAYNQAPAQYAAAESTLSAGESANGGQPFDILLVATDPGISNHYVWSPDFSNEIGNLDGITSLGVTDMGAFTSAVPEPSSAAALMLALPLLIWRKRRPA